MHEAAMTFVRTTLERITIPPGPVLEIGGRNINGTVRPLFDDIGPYASIDLRDGPGVDLVADVCDIHPTRTAQTLFQRPTVSCVVCCEVLEHAIDGQGICQWAYRVLAPGGVFLVTAANPDRAAHSGIDGGAVRPGEHYRGVSAAQLRAWLHAFTRREIVINGADVYAIGWKRSRR
jgi:hypothetical protein